MNVLFQDGAHHEVDSSDWAFHQATQFAFADCFDDGTWVVLEPIMNVEVIGPEEFQGPAVTMLTRRKGLIVNVESNDGWFTLVSEAPLNNMFGFSTELRSATQGKGEYSMEYARYAPADLDTQDRLVAEYQASLDTDNSGTKKKGKKN